MRRRDFIGSIGGAVVWPIAARAQQPERVRRIGVLANLPEGDPESLLNVAAFAQGLASLGWTVGRNVQIDYWWGEGDADRVRRNAAELVALAPDVILAHGSVQAGLLLQATRSVPIVFVIVTDPVGGGLVANLPRPGGNATGFMDFEYGLSGKWLELLKQIAPSVTRVAILRDPSHPSSIGQLGAIQSAAASFRVELTPIDVRHTGETERAVALFARFANSGLIVLANRLAAQHRDLITALAAQHRLPTVYPYRFYVASGGLISYGPNSAEQYRLAAGYVDRILRGEKPADLPVQAPTKYETVLNLKTAKALGLTIPETLLATADEVIQ
jgi:putative tryptophan/tyrosine transport system substrate-binding protein